jgi:hypothetical protein
MLGKNITREISPNVPKEDELAYVNRMKLHYKNQPRVKGYEGSESGYGNTTSNVRLSLLIFCKLLKLTSSNSIACYLRKVSSNQ